MTENVTPEVFSALRTDLQPYFINRDREIDGAILALVARCHIFLLSVPGTAKSMLIKEIVKRMTGAQAFLTLFTAFDEDSKLFGPQSINGLREGRRIRETNGRYLPNAQFFFADEIWKASSAFVNALLQALNERLWFDDGEEKDLPLWTMFCASNELPRQEHNELQAIYDRTGLRFEVPALTARADQLRLLRLPTPPENPDPILTFGQIQTAHREAMALPVLPETQEALVDVVAACVAKNVPVPSGRRLREAERIAKASAWLDGADAVAPGHLSFLADYLWESPDQHTEVAMAVYSVAAPLRAEVIDINSAVAELIVAVTEAVNNFESGTDDFSDAAMEMNRKVKQLADDTFRLEQRAKELDPRAYRDLQETWGRVQGIYDRVQFELMELDDTIDCRERIVTRGFFTQARRRRTPDATAAA